MWGFTSNAFAGTSGPKNDSAKPSQPSSDCSDDEISLNNSREEGLECPICWESFNIVENVPYVLWCGHTLCKNCVLGLQWAVVKLPTLPIQLPFFISCPWCNLLSIRLVYKGNLKFPKKNYFLLWMVESLNGDRVKSHSSSCGDHVPLPVPAWSWTRGLVSNNLVGPRNRHDDSRGTAHVNAERLQSSIRTLLLHMNRTRKKSPGTYKMETTGPKVLSRYLRGPTGSCHDHCKCAIKQTTETKPINLFPKRLPKALVDRTQVDGTNSIPRIKKPPSVIPKTTTRISKNYYVIKDQIFKKDAAFEAKKRDLKLKSENSQAKTYKQPSSRTPRRRHSDIFLPNNDMSIPSSRFPKRRLSDVASVSNVTHGSRINKNESRKDSKLPSIIKKSNSLKTSVSTSKTSAKVPPLRTFKSLPEPEVKGSRKSKPAKPIEEVMPVKTLHVIEPNISVDFSKNQSQSQSQSPVSPAAYSSSEEKVMTNGQKELQESSPSKKDDDPVKDGQERDQNELEVSSPSNEDDDPVKDGQESDQIGLEVSSPSKEDDKPATDGQHNDDVEDSEVNDTKDMTRVGKFVVETNDLSLDDLRFRRGTIISPQSDNNSPTKLQFKEGEEFDENETENGENLSLRRLSSDGVVSSYESQPISVDLKHQEMEEKKDQVLINNVIEETASKLIRTRKSKVKALVGAFEHIVSGSNN